MQIVNQAPYPTNSFPEWICKALIEAQNIAMTTPVIAAMSGWTAMSRAVCGLVDWKHPLTGQIRPTGTNTMTIGISGNGKTTCDAITCDPIYKQDEKNVAKYAQKQDEYKAKLDRWSSINIGLRKRLIKLTSAGESTIELETRLEAHTQSKPVKPRLRRLVCQDSVLRSIFEPLEGDGESITLIADEGHIILNSNAMRHIGVWNKIWDGCRLLTYDRGDGDNIVVRNPRGGINLMVQPAVLNEFLSTRGLITHSSGHWARYLIARSPSIQGYRLPMTERSELRDLLPFHNRLAELLQRHCDRADVSPITREVLEFDDNAKHAWLRIAANVENDIKPGNYLNDIGDFASKYMDIVSRLAAILHYFSASPGKINLGTLSRAEVIASWHLHEYKQMFSPAEHRSAEQMDAEKIYAYLYHRYFMKNCLEVSKNHIRQYCGVRGERFSHALPILISDNVIRIYPGRNKTQIIQLNSHFFSNHPIQIS